MVAWIAWLASILCVLFLFARMIFLVLLWTVANILSVLKCLAGSPCASIFMNSVYKDTCVFFLNTVTGTTVISPNNNIVGVFFIHVFCAGSSPIQELSQNKLVNIQTLSELPDCLRSEYSQLSMINFLQGPILGKMCVTRFDFQVRTT